MAYVAMHDYSPSLVLCIIYSFVTLYPYFCNQVLLAYTEAETDEVNEDAEEDTVYDPLDTCTMEEDEAEEK